MIILDSQDAIKRRQQRVKLEKEYLVDAESDPVTFRQNELR